MTRRSFKNFEGDIDAIAAYWVVRLNADDCTPEDRYAFDAWRREDPAHKAAFEKIKRGNDYLDRFMEAPEFQERIELARHRTRPPVLRRHSTRWIGAAAACLLIVVASIVFTPWLGGGARNGGSAVMAEAAEVYETRIGERSTVTLSDGTTATINTNSRIEVSYTDELREITLKRGQGFFDVAKDIDRPFVVVAGKKRVMALGTVFDVRFDDENEVQVTLVEGRVQVDDSSALLDGAARATSSNGDMKSAASSTSIELSPGERLIARANKAPEIVETDGVEETSWRRGQLVFRQRALSDVVAEMNRYNAQKLVLDADERVLALEVSGVFNTGGPASAFIDALEAMHPLEARRTGRDELTLVWLE